MSKQMPKLGPGLRRGAKMTALLVYIHHEIDASKKQDAYIYLPKINLISYRVEPICQY